MMIGMFAFLFFAWRFVLIGTEITSNQIVTMVVAIFIELALEWAVIAIFKGKNYDE